MSKENLRQSLSSSEAAD